MRTPIGDRVGLAVVGFVLVTGGNYVLFASDARAAYKIGELAAFTAHPWARSVAAALVVLLVFVTARWLICSMGVGQDGARHGYGTATLAIALKDLPGVDKISVRAVGEEKLRVSVRCMPGAPLDEIVSRVDTEAVSRVRGAAGRDALFPVLVTLHVRRG
ncbi:hypothetical protein [Herbidospora mongoliensis]|uniref:hypothetical protein n=1 Tax=Herbidospora mongoliensis TaxID=688067 RepID=UPI00082E682D|nr:hypothetical protein [Herbidospora mongoliensis]